MNNLKKELLLQLLIDEFKSSYLPSAVIQGQTTEIKLVKSNRGKRHVWSDAELNRIEFLYKKGHTVSSIANLMNLRKKQVENAIYNKLGLSREKAVIS